MGGRRDKAKARVRDPLKTEIDRLWSRLPVEKQATVVEWLRLLLMPQMTRRLLHELSDAEAEGGEMRLLTTVLALRQDVDGDESVAEGQPASETTALLAELALRDSQLLDLERLVEAHAGLSPTARTHAVDFVSALARRDLAAAHVAGRAALDDVEREFRRQRAAKRAKRPIDEEPDLAF